jgi:hypothetical protein
LIKTISEKGLHFDVVLFVFKTNVAKIRRMEDNITLILHQGGGLKQDEYQRLRYVRGEFRVWEKMDSDELCLWDIAEATSTITLIFVYIIQGLV